MKPNQKQLAIEHYGEGAIIAYEELYGKFDYDDFRNRYNGEFENDKDFVISILQSLPSWISSYIDWKRLVDDTMVDYNYKNGFYFHK